MWQYKGKDITEDDIPKKSIGFLYKITNTKDGMFYYGRKLLTKQAYKTVAGKKKGYRKSSDWLEYWSSSPLLLELIESEGKDKFVREILMFVDTKACLTFGEEYILFTTGSLFDQKCYNGNIRSRIQRTWFNKTPNFFNELSAMTL